MRRLFRDNEFNYRPEQANTSLILAAGDLDAEEVCQLIENGADVNAKNVHGQTALDWVVNFAWNDMDNALKIIDLLLDHGADVNAQNNQGVTALMHAAYRGDVPTLRLLLQRGAAPNLRRDDGTTALEVLELPSMRRGHKRVTKLLREAGGI